MIERHSVYVFGDVLLMKNTCCMYNNKISETMWAKSGILRKKHIKKTLINFCLRNNRIKSYLRHWKIDM